MSDIHEHTKCLVTLYNCLYGGLAHRENPIVIQYSTVLSKMYVRICNLSSLI